MTFLRNIWLLYYIFFMISFMHCLTVNARFVLVVTNSVLLSTPLVTATVKPTLTQPAISKTNTPLSSLGPGTLILANGSIVPVLPSTPILPQNPTVLTNPTPFLLNQQTLVVVTTSPVQSTTVPPKTVQAVSRGVSFVNRSLACIKPKRCTTRTVQANKVPIPALTSRYANSCVVFSSQNVSSIKNQQKVQQRKSNSEKHDKQEKVNEKVNGGKVENGNTETLKRKFEGDVREVKQQKTSENCEKDKEEEIKTVESVEKSIVSEASVSEDKTEQKRVCTSYSIDSICKERGEGRSDISNDETLKESTIVTKEISKDSNEAKNVKVNTTDSSNHQVSENVVTTVPSVPVITTVVDALPQTSSAEPTSKVDAIPDNVLKEIENSENIKDNQPEDTENKELEISLQHSELSNDIFASLHVQSGGQNPESTSPTAAFLLAFPLVSTLTGVKVSEVIEEDNSDSQRGTPTLLQIGTMDTTKPTQSSADNLTPSLLNLDNFSFFSSKDICSSFYQPFDTFIPTTTTAPQAVTTEKSEDKKKISVDANTGKNVKVVYDTPVTKEAALSVFDNFVNNKVDSRQQKVNQPFSNCGQVDANKVANIRLEKPAVTQENHAVQQQRNIVSVDNNLTATYNNYNVNYTPNASVYNTTQQNLDRKQSTQNQKNKCSTVNTYNMHTTRSSQTVAQCNTFNPFAETVKYTSSVCSYNTVTKPYIESLYTNPSTYSYNCQPDVNFSQANYNTHKNTQKSTDDKGYYSMNVNYNNTYNTDTRNNTFSNNYCQMHNNKDKFNTQVNKNKASNQTRPPVNWMTTPDIRHQTASNNDYFLPCFGKDLDNISTSIYPSSTFSVTSNTQTTYFNTNTSIYPTPDLTYSFPDAKKTLDSTFPSVPISTFQRSDMDENQFTWSPTKFPQLLDPSHSFVSTALPTLVGDLALGTTSVPYSEQKLEPLSKNKDLYNRQKDVRRNKPSSYDNHVNFLSVSQLVDHNKAEAMPARTTSRRNSGNRSNKPIVQQKSVKRNQKEAKDNQNYQSVPCSKPSDKNHVKQPQVATQYNLQQNNQDWIGEATKQNHQAKNPSSSYSAEALIGHQPLSDDVGIKQRNNSVQGQCGYSTSNSLPVSFLTDNIIPYFPPVELPQDTNFIQNQNCQNNTFNHNFPSASIQSNTYSSASLISTASTITTNYLSTTNFMSEIGTHDYNPIISDNLNLFPHSTNSNKTCMKNSNTVHKQVNRQDERKATVGAACSGNNYSKKTKKKTTNDNNVPGFVDFSFLSMPAAINSPILPDDFHANLLPPPTPQLYPCKNPLYPSKQNTDLNAGSALLPIPPVPVTRGNIQHPEISPSVNNVGTSLTNFNLSTIFPEINKVSVFGIFVFIIKI